MLKPLLLLILLGLSAPARAQTVILVRHAEKAAAPAADPPLTAAGQARAQALSERLRGRRVSSILTSPSARTRETARALSLRTGVRILPVPVGPSLHEHIATTAALARRAPVDSTVVIVGHSNTVPVIARALGYSEAPAIADCRYDLMLTVELNPPASPTAERFGPASICPPGQP